MVIILGLDDVEFGQLMGEQVPAVRGITRADVLAALSEAQDALRPVIATAGSGPVPPGEG